MDIFMPMSTTARHNRLVNTFIGDVLHLSKKKEIYALQSDCPLVYWGTKKLPTGFELVDVKNIGNIDHFIENAIMELEYAIPDFMFFKSNPYLENKKQTRTAGRPDLIVEIWSDSNSENDRAFLQNLYATSDITEHWYIEQDSNKVECYMGNRRLSDQCLTKILRTQRGLEFDLRYLAI